MRKLMLIFLLICFLTGILTKAENASEEIEKKAKPVSTAIGGGKAFEAEVIDSDITGEWTQDEIEYFQKKGYVGDKERYTPYSIEYCPSYLSKKIDKSKYGKIGKKDLEDITKNEKIDKEELLRYFSLLHNEIYARKGYIFDNYELKEFFGKMNWYQPEQKEITLTGREERNLKVIEELEEIVKNTKIVSELFTEQVIVKAKWGDEPGEFGLGPLPESYEYKTSFTIDAYGNVYIVDPNNQRINVFNKEGKFKKGISIPKEWGKDLRFSIVEGIGVDGNGNIYIASSSTTALLHSGSSGEVVFKIDEKGNILDSLTFMGYYVYPAIFFESDNMMYLWGSWEMEITAGVPLEFNKKERVIPISINYLRGNSFNQYKKSIKLGKRKININYDKAPVVFNESKDSRVVFNAGGGFVFQNSNGEIKATVSHNSDYFRYYPLGYGIPYKGYYVIISVWPYIDEDLNIYCVDGTDTHLHVIKYTPTEEVWE
ncbi:YARHG domain-containing protein [candidate division WOR-3 bacterium]|nr:YARHG domain-containing protein [candidate division WOR-3 bacterium]